MVMQRVNVNTNGNPVVFYVDNDVYTHMGSNVTAVIYANGEIKAHGHNINSSNYEPTYMTGLFIAESVHGIDSVIWNASDLCGEDELCPPYDGEDDDPLTREAEFDVVAWPNPSSTEFSMRLQSLDVRNDARVDVFDLNNKHVHSAIFGATDEYSFGSKLESGLYIVKITQGENLKILRLIKY